MQTQKSYVTLQKVEFQSITGGLKVYTEQIDQLDQQSYPTQEIAKQKLEAKGEFGHKINFSHRLLTQRFQTLSNDAPIRTDLSTAEGLQQLQENKPDEQKLKFDKLRKYPSTFFEKIPKEPLSLMNSTRRNKMIQISILAKSKQAVKDHITNDNILTKQSPAQDAAVRELLDNFQTQFNFRTAVDAKKKRQVEELKAKYLKTFFIKNIPTKEKTAYKYFGESGFSNRNDKPTTSKSHQFNNDFFSKPFAQSFQTQTQSCCNDQKCCEYCSYVCQIYEKKLSSRKKQLSNVVNSI